MATHREAIFVEGLWKEKAPLPATIPEVQEVGCTSAPLESMSFHFANFCKVYNEDYVLCKNESTDPAHCLKEGRKVTRCAIDLINKLKENCDSQWERHWTCLDYNNHHYWQCRKEEREFNDCVFAKLGLTKVIPETPEGKTQIHLKEKPLYK
ncbi:hypothetical protein SmJEL517_g00120 [Synchytrium microbalum]|uniref:NADH-ubiquinone oxidoreductase n=1 Tax=Synchytrium microbalum TaxID=1806994 RepID=A0A507C921_9FUNG|nr:uncharacterized protein SmJEL517_g00120 [Synchytrium microbalum]TPX38090.1 hypothetical protein SmJEL517_g00120 [Synchytrium microbalum]